MKDSKGVEITRGCRVRQGNAYNSQFGALEINCNREGTVVRLFRVRAEVQFDGRTLFVGYSPSDELVTDRVHADYLEVLPEEREQ